MDSQSSGTANFTLFSWQLGSASAGNMTVNAPAAAVQGTTGTINLTFSGLAPATKYHGLGGVRRLGRFAEPDDRPHRHAIEHW